MPTTHCLLITTPADPRAAALLASAHALGLTHLTALHIADLIFIEGDLTPAHRARLIADLLTDPVTQTATWRSDTAPSEPNIIETALRPGVTNPVADHIFAYAQRMDIPLTRAATGQRYTVHAHTPLTPADLHTLARRLLVNDVIETYTLGPIPAHFPLPAPPTHRVDTLPIRTLSPDALLALSTERRAALDAAEMAAIQAYYQAENRDPTDVEFEMIAQTWSEHCVHKTFKARITTPTNATINSLLRTYIRAATEKINAPWVRSAFVDNAGILDFDDTYEVSFKVETHNHPSAIEPFGGANTGVGGVIRDVLGVSARPIAATDVLCFGPLDTPLDTLPEGVLHPRRIASGVVAGIEDYGNKIGIPTVNGAILYDPGYTANPLVFCGCVGLAPKGYHCTTPQVNDRVIVLGGRTGRDGLRGATFSSMTMDAQTGAVAGASVQIGDPITEKGLIEVILRARDARLYTAITDCGAGGLSSAVGEMSSQLGAEVELTHVRLKYPGLAPWEIWLSEAQERMVLAVPPAHLPALQAIADIYAVELTDIGHFTGSGRLRVTYNGQPVLDLENHFLHEGIPQRQLIAAVAPTATDPGPRPTVSDHAATLLQLLAHPNIASKASVIRVYDHEVQGGTVVKPLTGLAADAPSDGAVLKPIGTPGLRGLIITNGINPFFGKLDPYRMAHAVLDEAVRNAVALGADPDRLAVLDNFCWGDPRRPATLADLLAAAQGCHDAALLHRTPFISGKDSLNNEYLGPDGQRHAIPPTLLISAIGIIDDITTAVTSALKHPDDVLYLLGDTRPEFGGSHLHLLLGASGGAVPAPAHHAPALYRALHRAITTRLVRAAHDLSEGGLAVALAEMCIGGRLGAAITLPADSDPTTLLYSESNGRLLVAVAPQHTAAFEHELHGLPLTRLGHATANPTLTINHTTTLLTLPVASLAAAFTGQPPAA